MIGSAITDDVPNRAFQVTRVLGQIGVDAGLHFRVDRQWSTAIPQQDVGAELKPVEVILGSGMLPEIGGNGNGWDERRKARDVGHRVQVVVDSFTQLNPTEPCQHGHPIGPTRTKIHLGAVQLS